MNNSFDVEGIILSDDIKLKLESLEDVNLTPPTSIIYLDDDYDLQLNLDKIFKLQTNVTYINIAVDRIITEIFGGYEIIISAPQYSIFQKNKEIELVFKGLLNNQEIELIFGKQVILKYKLLINFSFSFLTNIVPIINSLKLSNPELILTKNS